MCWRSTCERASWNDRAIREGTNRNAAIPLVTIPTKAQATVKLELDLDPRDTSTTVLADDQAGCKSLTITGGSSESIVN
jgi:hypothetical protein